MAARGASRRQAGAASGATLAAGGAGGGDDGGFALEPVDRIVSALASELAARVVFLVDGDGLVIAAAGDTRTLQGSPSLAGLMAFTMGPAAIAALHAEQEGCFAIPDTGASAILCLCRRRALMVVMLDAVHATPRARERARTVAQAVADILGDVRNTLHARGGDGPFAELSEDDLAGLFAI